MSISYTVDTSCTPSPMEIKIATKLHSLNIPFAMEVIFEGCINPITGFPLRYDFYCYQHNLLIEYDGRLYHVTDEVKTRDKIKNEFARKNKIKLVRLKNRADCVDFFNGEYFKGKTKTKPKIEKETQQRYRHNRAFYQELSRLETYKSESQAQYVDRMKYLHKHNNSLFNEIYHYLKDQKHREAIFGNVN